MASPSDATAEATAGISGHGPWWLLCGVLALSVAIYRDLLGWFWWNVSLGGVESHCASIPLIALGLAWLRRHDLARLPRRSSTFGLLLMTWGGLLQLLGTASDSLLAEGLSLVACIHGGVLYLHGPARTGVLLGPICFLVFMLPLRYPIEILLGFPLRLLSTQWTAWVLGFMGIPAERTGTVLTLPNFTVQIGSPCSGLNVLAALLIMGAFFCVAERLSPRATLLTLLSTVPAALVANSLRIAVIGVVGSRHGQAAAMKLFHDYSGFVTFLVAAALVAGVGHLARGRWPRGESAGASRGDPRDDPTGKAGREGPRRAAGLLGRMALLLATVLVVDLMLGVGRTGLHARQLATFPVPVAWGAVDEQLSDEEWKLQASTGGEIRRVAFRWKAQPVWLALVSAGASWRAHHPPEFCYMAQGWTVHENRVQENPDGASFRELLAEKDGERRIVQYWFTDGRRSTASLLSRWVAALETGFRGRERHPWLLVILSAPAGAVAELDSVRPHVWESARQWLAQRS